MVRCGWLSKEGAHTLSRAFPSQRFCVLVDGRLEYYEERQVILPVQRDGSSGCEVTNWNLVVHVLEPDAQGVAVGDIVTGIDGFELSSCTLNEQLTAGVAGNGANYKLMVLRPKGDVQLADALVQSIGRDRIQITPKELSTRPPFIFIANGASGRDEWLEAIEHHASDFSQTPSERAVQ